MQIKVFRPEPRYTIQASQQEVDALVVYLRTSHEPRERGVVGDRLLNELLDAGADASW